MSLASYKLVQNRAEAPRAAEERLIREITREMQGQWQAGVRGCELMPVLHRNREMWSVFAAACGSSGNALPDGLRAGIVSLALWVQRFTSDVVTGRETIDPLIEVNLALLEGLAPGRLAA